LTDVAASLVKNSAGGPSQARSKTEEVVLIGQLKAHHA
jgi:hypothetical protein